MLSTTSVAGLQPRSETGLLTVMVLALVVCLDSTASVVQAQLTRNSSPDARYFIGVEEIFEGDLRTAERYFRREVNRGIQFGTTRWVDSICYHAMLGEVNFRLGRTADALAEFDQACQLFLQSPNWLLNVKFPDPPRADPLVSLREHPPWGRTERQAPLGRLSSTMLVMRGRMPDAEEIKRQRITVIEPPQFFKLEVAEIIRCTALAIRRRNQILGPLGKYDRLSKDLVDVLAAGGLAPPNHWSRAWIDLQLGLAQIGVGDLDQAHIHLSRALVADGRFDHPLTCVVLLEQGRLALEAGNPQLAARLLAEASFSAFYFENWNVLEESLSLGQLNHVIVNGPGVYPALESAAQWSRRAGLRLLTASFRTAQAENLAVHGEADAAARALSEAARWLGNAADGRTGIRHLYVQALVAFQQARNVEGHEVLQQAIVRQSLASLSGFQLQLTNRLFDGTEGGRITSRAATSIYEQLLDDPRPQEWALDPLDFLAQWQLPQTESFDRWFQAAMDRSDVQKAIEIADQAKRRRFQAALPWGGRLLALRDLLESPPAQLDNAGALERQQILTRFPGYQQLAAEGLAIRRALDQLPVLADAQPDYVELNNLYDRWEETALAREKILREVGLRREPATIRFPPLRDLGKVQKGLEEEDVLVIFHAAAGQLHGFLLTDSDYHAWHLGRMGSLYKNVSELLRSLGNYGPGRSLTQDDLEKGAWKTAARATYQQVFRDARLALDQTSRMIIVPEDLLWYLPFESLIPDDGAGDDVLLDRVLIRYVPLAGLAVADRPLRRVRRTGIVATQVGQDAAEAYFDAGLERLAKVVAGPVRLPVPLPEPASLLSARLDMLVSFDDVLSEAPRPLAWSLLPNDRGRGGSSTMTDLMGIPLGGPERIMLSGFSTRAEDGLRGVARRGATGSVRPGGELFHASCALAADGARTALLSRWRTGGQTNLDLVHEFVQELPHISAEKAWQRSVLLARDAPLDAAREPRLKLSKEVTATPTADHPFFWAGYLLFDNAGDPQEQENEEMLEDEQPVVQFK